MVLCRTKRHSKQETSTLICKSKRRPEWRKPLAVQNEMGHKAGTWTEDAKRPF